MGSEPGVTQRAGGEAPGGAMMEALEAVGVTPLTMPLDCPDCADVCGRDPGWAEQMQGLEYAGAGRCMHPGADGVLGRIVPST